VSVPSLAQNFSCQKYLKKPFLVPMGYKEDLQSVHAKIDRLGKQLTVDSPKASISKWTIASPIIGGCALLLAGWVAYNSHSATDLKNQIKIEVNDQLRDPLKQVGELSGDIKEIKGILALSGIRAFISVPKSEIQANLPQLRKVVEIAKQQKIAVPISTIHDVQQRLLEVKQNAPDYWPAVLQFLQFASNGLAPSNIPPPSSEAQSSQIVVDHTTFRNMIVLLDGGMLDKDVFNHCRIIFTNTPVKMRDVTFIDCVFEFPISSEPSPYIQQAGTLLLASNLTNVSIPHL